MNVKLNLETKYLSTTCAYDKLAIRLGLQDRYGLQVISLWWKKNYNNI